MEERARAALGDGRGWQNRPAIRGRQRGETALAASPHCHPPKRFGAAALCIAAIVTLQIAKFGAASLAISTPAAVGLMYAAPVGAALVAIWFTRGGRMPAVIARPAARAAARASETVERIAARFGRQAASA